MKDKEIENQLKKVFEHYYQAYKGNFKIMKNFFKTQLNLVDEENRDDKIFTCENLEWLLTEVDNQIKLNGAIIAQEYVLANGTYLEQVVNGANDKRIFDGNEFMLGFSLN